MQQDPTQRDHLSEYTVHVLKLAVRALTRTVFGSVRKLSHNQQRTELNYVVQCLYIDRLCELQQVQLRENSDCDSIVMANAI
jgi:hypothetical protein